jgi:hypothetical protein
VFDSIRTVMREPLLHFLLAGAGLFLLFNVVSEPEMTGDEQIIVSSGQIEHLVTLFVKTRVRPPSDAELRSLIDNFILEEVLYREATAIGLDQDDTIIRRRLKQKMEFLVDDFSATEPTDEDLQQFLDADPDRFQTDARISFEQVYLVDSSLDTANAMLVALQNDEPVKTDNALASGLLPGHFEDASASSITSQFGASFKDSLFALEAGQWTGPVESPFGLHLIRIDQIVEARVPALAEIRSVVKRDWLSDRRNKARQVLFDELRAKYTITIEAYEAPDL